MSSFSSLLSHVLQLSARGGLPRFLVETFVTPSVYPRVFRAEQSSQWKDFILSSVVGERVIINPIEALRVLERNDRFRAIARRRYLEDTLKIPTDAFQRVLGCLDAPSRSSIISAAFPEIMLFNYLGDENVRRRILLKQAKRAQSGRDLKDWSLEDILEAFGCCVHGATPFNAFCDSEGVYELFNAEYIDGLSEHLKGKYNILEVGAGSGRLSHLLQRKLGTKYTVIATDSTSWKHMKGHSPRYPVVKCDYRTAVDHFKPDVIIACWLPMNQDWSVHFRKAASCQEYIVIGSPYCCGKLWGTYGIQVPAFDPTVSTFNEPPPQERWPIDVFEWISGSQVSNEHGVDYKRRPPYEEENWQKKELSKLSKLQLCRLDRTISSGQSKTFSFTRKT